RSQNHDVADDGRRRVHADFARLEIDLLVVAELNTLFQVEDPVSAERRHRLAGPGVQLYQTIARRHEHDAIVALAVGPVRDTAARKLARRHACAFAFAQAVDPLKLASPGIERDHGPARAAGRIDRALYHQRRSLQLVLGERPEAVGLEPPRHFEL